jgi:hypothetical protein
MQRILKSIKNEQPLNVVQITQLGLLLFAGTWLGSFVVLPTDWLRYLLPVAILSSVFIGVYVNHLAERRKQSVNAIRRRPNAVQFTLRTALLGAALITLMTPLMAFVYETYLTSPSSDYDDVVRYLNTQTPTAAKIETYESELFFLVDRPFNYPPNSVQHQLNRQVFLGQEERIEYDPLETDPDYLVVGPAGQMWHLYEEVLQSDAFHLAETLGSYEIYQRERS